MLGWSIFFVAFVAIVVTFIAGAIYGRKVSGAIKKEVSKLPD